MLAAPFVVGQWVRGERFYGRAALIEEVLRGQRNWMWLLGTRRIGKTSLLKQIEMLTTSDKSLRYFPVFWDFQGADDSEELNEGFQEALLDAEERLEELGISVEDITGADLFQTMSALRRKMRSLDMRLLLLCDEVEELLKLHKKDPGLLRKLRRAMQSHEDIRSVLASTIRLWALAEQRGDTSPFLHGFAPPLYIHRLNKEEAKELIRQRQLPTESRPIFDEEIVETIRARCDNHPYLMQLVCKRYCELEDVEEAVEQVATDPMVSYFFAEDFRMLSRQERDILRVIAESSAANSDTIQGRLGLVDDDLGLCLHRLEHLGYVRRNVERRFELVNHFFRRWFKEKPQTQPGLDSRPSRPEPALVADQSTIVAPKTSEKFDGRYRLVEEVGHGATGRVYKAYDEMLRATIAIKILREAYSSHPEAFERIRDEILLARDLDHGNILKIYHLGDCAGQKYMTMGWVGTRTLATLNSQEGPLPIFRAIDLAWKIASALAAAHAQKVIHRDIKPQNILIDAEGEPQLADFGLARLLGTPGRTGPGVFLGTPDYASPEQARLLPADERADVYSLGVVIFEMVTGQKPFPADTAQEVLRMHKSEPAPDPRERRPEIPEALASVILRCLEKEPAQRFANAGELERELGRLRETSTQ
jgi:serine/threonine-protein kinase